MDPQTHPDPFQDALQHGVQRAVQLVSGVVTAAQVYLFHQQTQARAVSERSDQARRALRAQIRAEQEAARARWAPALDPAWLRGANLLQVARVWSAAMPYADRAVPWYEPAAATAMRKCEERLRELHPYAMAHYDRLRADGLGPAEAMQQAAPLFARPARARDGSAVSRPHLDAGHGEVWTAGAAPAPSGPGDLGAGQADAERDRAVSAERARAADLDAAFDLKATPGKDERTENLAEATGAAAEASAAAARASRSTRPWEHDFPLPIRDVVATARRTARPAESRRPAAQGPSQQAARVSGTRP